VSGATFLEAAGAKLEARFIGRSPAGAPTLVFLHEGLGSVAQWKDFPDRVAESLGLGALVYSRRGYGASDPVPAAARPVRFMHDEAYEVLPALLDAAKLDSVILVGHSDGASISLLFAAEDSGRRVRGVVALAPHLFVEDVTVKSIAAITEAWKTTDLRARLARYHGANVDGAFLGWSGVWLDPAFRAWNIEREVARIDVPVLAIQGEDDEYGTLGQVEALKRLVRGSVETRALAKCGHSPQRDQPDETLAAIHEWSAARRA
jgi:pimeloyl-ACP methyl ester carboxylesterase